MNVRAAPIPQSAEPAGPGPVRRVLIVDDSRAQRMVLRLSLQRWGYLVDEAGSGAEAMELLAGRRFDFVLSDWMMPGMTGVELCSRFRALPRERYAYFILLTAMSERAEIARGLEAGADDFLAKPVNAAELHARMIAGERIISMEEELSGKNRLVSATLAEISALYAALGRDLDEARKLQAALVRETWRDFGTASVSVLLRPSGHVGGDLVGYFPLNDRQIVFYAIDVAGHGVTSAILAARLAGLISGVSPGGNFATAHGGRGGANSWPPEQVAVRLNRLMHDWIQTDHYFTCLYAEADLVTGRVRFVQAGHPHPLLIRTDGSVRILGDGGLPVGLIADATYDRVDVRLAPGERILLTSDGLTEAVDPAGNELGPDGLVRIVGRHHARSGAAFLGAVVDEVRAFAGDRDLADDASAALFEYRGP